MKQHNIGLNMVKGPNTGYAQKFTTEDHSTPHAQPGTVIECQLWDRCAQFVYVKANATVADGSALALALLTDNADVDATQATTTYNLTGTADFTADEFDGMGGMVVIDANGGLAQGAHYIQRNSANILYTDRVWGEALTTASDFLTHMLNAVVLADSSAVGTYHCACFGIGVITSGNYGWAQISGVHWRALSIGDTDAPVIGEYVVPDATAGVVRGMTAGASTVDEFSHHGGLALCTDAEASATAEGIPIIITNCAKFWL